MDKTLKYILIIVIILIGISVSTSIVYYFVIRPIQQDKKLDKCLDSMWSLYGNQDEVYKSKVDLCIKETKGY